ncbi:hypothetical protein OCS_02244 [Ophiocordyceps sinensis CO18]|uniref:AHC1-like C2H2 zinc-finger domain-containing protein n=1 Tax=Ophiocordyceps sinensis (strain Co18 / CGMCC 3.14243) TaxID=911162 RepID=T5AHI3_OPHSC|nr:hypothetical protein OCS_02244 [Ophiocordyceps sinensis CO18]
MFRSDSPGSEQRSSTAHDAIIHRPRPLATLDNVPATLRTPRAPKRCRDAADGADGPREAVASAKRAKIESHAPCQGSSAAVDPDTRPSDLDYACDIIRHQFGLEVLLKHDELRLINQELAKCQVALEQLRRCHLIPYPSACPTPDQMVDISDGKGPALVNPSGESTAPWAPPFGVVDGPYSRHYAKWLIPDPSFDRARPDEHLSSQDSRARGSAAPVQLVCLDCNRQNFSSTQGFINHCRIAHRRDFKSHEEAAVQSGQPIDVVDAGPAVADEKPPAASSSSVLVHPLARHDMTEQQAYAALRSRISESLALYHAGKLPGVDRIPSARDAQGSSGSGRSSEIDGVPETPHLSRLMQARNFSGSLRDLVADAKTRESLEAMAPDEESDDGESTACTLDGARGGPQARMPVAMRVPARSGKSPAPTATHGGRPASSKGRLREMPLVSPTGGAAMSTLAPNAVSSDEEMDMDEVNLSPSTLISNNAPSLVSDDGEYDDSDEGSSVSGANDHLDGTPMSDVAEITLDDDHEPRALRRGSSGVAGPMKLRKDDAKHVTLVSHVKSNAKQRRHHGV